MSYLIDAAVIRFVAYPGNSHAHSFDCTDVHFVGATKSQTIKCSLLSCFAAAVGHVGKFAEAMLQHLIW